MRKFDVIVVGTGPSGSRIAAGCSKQGLNVAAVDSRGYGGTCPLRGCIPKKVLSDAAEVVQQSEQMQGKGIGRTSNIEWKELMQFKRSFTEPVPEKQETSMQDAGVETFDGVATFVNDQEIMIGQQTLFGKNVVIATGAKPMPLPIEGNEHLTTSDEFLDLDKLPSRILFVGGGYISFELAHVAAKAGCDVHILQRGDQPLKQFDKEMVQQLIEAMEETGVSVHLNTEVEEIKQEGSQYQVVTKKNGKKEIMTGDMVVHGGGRIPELEDLQLENGNVAYEKAGITVNKYLQSTTNSHVYAAGDAADTEGAPLTPVAGIEARVVIENIVNGNRGEADYTGVPSVVFTMPKVASAGITEEEAEKNGYDIESKFTDMKDWFTYAHKNESRAAVKIITDKKTGRLLGAHMISSKADELINFFAMAIQLQLSTEEIKKLTLVFPTAISDIPTML